MTQPPQAELDLEFVYGYAGMAETAANLYLTSRVRAPTVSSHTHDKSRAGQRRRCAVLKRKLVHQCCVSARNHLQGEHVYYVAGIAIVYSKATHTQRFFRRARHTATHLSPSASCHRSLRLTLHMHRRVARLK